MPPVTCVATFVSQFAFKHLNCDTCHLTKPSRRSVSKRAEHSGNVTVQIDYMPMGHQEKGWKSEVGAYIFSSRTSKLLKTYPVKCATAREATEVLNEYFTYIVPHMREKIDCIQTDAGTQFSGNEWRSACNRYKVKCRSCPTDYQAMNGQVERSLGILAMKMRALLMERNVPEKYWPLALEAASYLLNRIPHTSLNGVSPLESCTGEKPNLRHARVFGCAAFVQVAKERKARCCGMEGSTSGVFDIIA